MQEDYNSNPTLMQRIRDLGPKIAVIYASFELARLLTSQSALAADRTPPQPRKCGQEFYYGSMYELGGPISIGGYTFHSRDRWLIQFFTEIKRGNMTPIRRGDEERLKRANTAYAGPKYPFELKRAEGSILGNPNDDRELIGILKQLDQNNDCKVTRAEIEKGLEEHFK
ncbi:hypothetical protein HYX04_03785 [Candidatus Woesearchaeota archaeon]|nr:hypothetical protein [Candidatus Woesearchaeota archaeon]